MIFLLIISMEVILFIKCLLNIFNNFIEEKNDFNFADFTIKNYIKDDEEKENKNEFQLFNNETEGNEDNNNNFYVTKNLGKMTLKDFQSKKYETARENNKHDFENQNYVSKSDLTSNKKNKSSEKDNLKNNLGKNRKDIMDNSKNTLDKNGIIINFFNFSFFFFNL